MGSKLGTRVPAFWKESLKVNYVLLLLLLNLTAIPLYENNIVQLIVFNNITKLNTRTTDTFIAKGVSNEGTRVPALI